MGSPQTELGSLVDERPRHSVEISRPYYMAVYPVTQSEYVQVTHKKNPSWCSKEGGGKAAVQGLNTSRFPVEQVSWNEAMEYCQALNRLDSKRPAQWQYGLPTEAEWEYACRAGSTASYFFGDEPKTLGKYAWYKGNAKTYTNEVGTREPEPLGSCTSMHGNVFQWCADWYDKDYYATSDNKDPQCNKVGITRVLRGGSWRDDPGRCRAGFRNGDAPGSHADDTGLRVCCRPAD